MADEVAKDMWRVACGAGAVKAEAVANRATNNAAWAVSLLAREQLRSPIAFLKKKRRKNRTALAFSLSSHRYSYMGLLFSSRFIA
jgi:hypothetical protein